MVLCDGHVIDLRNPKPFDFDPERTARALASERRFAGNYGDYSVAQHVVLTARVCKAMGGSVQEQFAALHHDDDESVTGDMPKPVKRMLNELGDGAWDRVVQPLQVAICERYSVDISAPIVKDAETVVFAGELRWVVESASRAKYADKDTDPSPLYGAEWQPAATDYVPWEPARARLEYLALHVKLRGELDGGR